MAARDGITDRPYDEAISIGDDDSDEEVSTPASSEGPSPSNQSKPSPNARDGGQQLGSQQHAPAAKGGGQPKSARSDKSDGSSSSEASSSSDSTGAGDREGDDKNKNIPIGAYNPDDYKGLNVSSEIEEVFQYISRYKPHTIELDASLKPFIPELIPSIGEVDASLKMPRPDGAPSGLGTVRLDEPTMNPSDPSILDLQLRSLSKNQDLQPMEVRSIENAEKNPKEIENWFRRIDDLNRSKPAPTVQYSRRMPDIEQLMRVWPAEFEEFLQQNPLPDLVDLDDLELPNYIRVIASILDVPVHNQLTETLHVIFTLYAEFKSNAHFAKADTGNFGPNIDQYNFGSVPNFAAAGQGGGAVGPPMGASAAGLVFGGPPSESIAPSRAPSPAGKG
jgi:intraflagellar transport protein 46